MGRYALAIVTLALVAAGAVGCGRGPRDQVVARVNKQPITQRELWNALEQADNGDAGRRALDALIVRQLVRQEAEKKGIEIDQAELQERLEGLKDYVLAGTGLDFPAWLQRTGQTEEDVIARLRLQMLTAKLVLTDRDREQYFEESKERLKELPHNNEAVIYRQIVLGSKQEAEATYKELTSGKQGGADFAKVAEAKSLDPISRTRGGMVGWAVKGKTGDAELEKVLFSLKPGEISKPMVVKPKAPEGKSAQAMPERWRIVKVEKYIPPHEITLKGNADVIEEWAMNDPRYQLQLQDFFDNLRAKADVEVVAPRYQSLAEAYQQRREARQRAAAPTPTAAPIPAPQAGGQAAPQKSEAPAPKVPKAQGSGK